MSKIEIRQANENDIPAIEDIMLDVVDFLDSIGQPQWERQNVTWQGLSRHFKADDFYIASIENIPVGCFALIDYDPAFWPGVEKGSSLFIHKLAVKRRGSKQGVPKAMIDFAKKQAIELGINEIRLDTHQFRDKVRAIYEREGFVCVGERCLFNKYHTAFYVWTYLQIDIPGYDTFVKIEPISKGWSEDKKYCVTDNDGTRYLLRVSPPERYEHRKNLHEMMKRVSALDVPMCQPIDFGLCSDGVYSLQSWIDGEDLEAVLPLLSETQQYVLGVQSGEILRKIHSIPAPRNDTNGVGAEDWAVRFNKKIDRNIALNRNCEKEGFAVDGFNYLQDFVNSNRNLLDNRPQCFQHGDYHIGNMMIENGKLKIIDFDRYDFGDPWEEFNRMTFNAATSPHFATGLLHGYFNGEPPKEFFMLQSFYIASTHLGGLSWARKFGESEIIFTKNQIADILSWYDNMQRVVPNWYLRGIIK